MCTYGGYVVVLLVMYVRYICVYGGTHTFMFDVGMDVFPDDSPFIFQ